MKKTFTIILSCFLIFSIVIVFSSVKLCKAETLNVGSGQTYSSIQDAIDAANASGGDLIYVHSGTYEEDIEINIPITLQGQDKSNTIINGKSGNVIEISNTESVVISGFTIQSPVGEGTKCIMITNSNNCNIQNNNIKNGYDGVYLLSSNDNTFNDNTISGNSQDGISLYASNDNTIKENIITDNNVYGSKIYNSDNNLIYLNDFSDNTNKNAYDNRDTNNWYTGSEGNYWDDYNDYDSNNDGIGDNPYTNGGVNDEKPLGYFIYQDPTAHITSISPNPAEEGQTINFNGYGTPIYRIIGWEWKAGSTVIGNSEDVTYSNLAPGTYTISFRVRDIDGWSTADTRSLIVTSSSNGNQNNQKPIANIQSITPSHTTFGSAVYFTGYGTDSDGIVTKYNWSSSIDGYLPESSSFTITSLSVGIHTITFKVRDNEGLWSDTVDGTATISEVPTENDDPVAVSNGPYTAYVNDSINFDASYSYDNDGSIAKYKWDFGDGNTANGQTATHSYTQEDEYTVVLTITDNYGAQDTETTTATILSETGNQQNNNNETDDDTNDKWVIPGFETITILFVIISFIIIKKKRK